MSRNKLKQDSQISTQPLLNVITGMATDLSPDKMTNNIVQYLENFTLNTMGTISPRAGYSTYKNLKAILASLKANANNFQSMGIFSADPGTGLKYVALIDGYLLSNDADIDAKGNKTGILNEKTVAIKTFGNIKSELPPILQKVNLGKDTVKYPCPASTIEILNPAVIKDVIGGYIGQSLINPNFNLGTATSSVLYLTATEPSTKKAIRVPLNPFLWNDMEFKNEYLICNDGLFIQASILPQDLFLFGTNVPDGIFNATYGLNLLFNNTTVGSTSGSFNFPKKPITGNSVIDVDNIKAPWSYQYKNVVNSYFSRNNLNPSYPSHNLGVMMEEICKNKIDPNFKLEVEFGVFSKTRIEKKSVYGKFNAVAKFDLTNKIKVICQELIAMNHYVTDFIFNFLEPYVHTINNNLSQVNSLITFNNGSSTIDNVKPILTGNFANYKFIDPNVKTVATMDFQLTGGTQYDFYLGTYDKTQVKPEDKTKGFYSRGINETEIPHNIVKKTYSPEDKYAVLYKATANSKKNWKPLNNKIKNNDWFVYEDTLYCVTGDPNNGILTFPFSGESVGTARQLLPYQPTFSEVSAFGLNTFGTGGYIPPQQFSKEYKMVPRLTNFQQQLDGELFKSASIVYNYRDSVTGKFVAAKSIENSYPMWVEDLTMSPSTPILLDKPIKVLGEESQEVIENWTGASLQTNEVSNFLATGFESGTVYDTPQYYERIDNAFVIFINPTMANNKTELADPRIGFFPNNTPHNGTTTVWDFKVKSYPVWPGRVQNLFWPFSGSTDPRFDWISFYLLSDNKQHKLPQLKQDYDCYGDGFSFLGYSNTIFDKNRNSYYNTQDVLIEGKNTLVSENWNNNLLTHIKKAVQDYIVNGKKPICYTSTLASPYIEHTIIINDINNTNDNGYNFNIASARSCVRDTWLESLIIRLAKITKITGSELSYDSWKSLTVNANLNWTQEKADPDRGSWGNQPWVNKLSTIGNGLTLAFTPGSYISFKDDIVQMGANYELMLTANIIMPSKPETADAPDLVISHLGSSIYYHPYDIQTNPPEPSVVLPNFYRWLIKPVPVGTDPALINELLLTDPISDLQKKDKDPKTTDNNEYNLSGWINLMPENVPDGTATTGIPLAIDPITGKAKAFLTYVTKLFPNYSQFISIFCIYNDILSKASMKEGQTKRLSLSRSKLFKIDLQKNEASDMLSEHEVEKCPYSLVTQGVMILYGNPEKKNRVYMSAVNNFAYIPNNNYVDLNFKLNEFIQTIVPLQNSLILFTDQQIYRLTIDKNLGLTAVLTNGSMGTIHRESVVNYGNSLYFLWINGLWELKNPYISTTDGDRIANVKQIGASMGSFFQRLVPEIGKYEFSCHASVKNNEIRYLIPNYPMIGGKKKGLILTYNPQLPILMKESAPISGFSIYTSRGEYDPKSKTFEKGIFDSASKGGTYDDYYLIYNNGVFYNEDRIEETDYSDKLSTRDLKTNVITTIKYPYSCELLTKQSNLNDPTTLKAILELRARINTITPVPGITKGSNITDLNIAGTVILDGVSDTNNKRSRPVNFLKDTMIHQNTDVTQPKNTSKVYGEKSTDVSQPDNYQAMVLGENLLGKLGNYDVLFKPENNSLAQTVQLDLSISGKTPTTPLFRFDLKTILISSIQIPIPLGYINYGSNK